MIAAKFRSILNQKILYRIGKKLSFLDPNFVTLLAYPLVLIAAYFIVNKQFALALVFAVASTLVDNLDGAIAKSTGKKTLFGSYWDAITDRIQEVVLLLSIAILGYWEYAFFAITSGFLVSYAKPRAEMLVPLNNLDAPSVGERAERLLIILASLAIAIVDEKPFGYDVFVVALSIFTIMSLAGFVQRFNFYSKILKEEDRRRASLE